VKELIRKLVESFGPAGFEDEVRAIIHREVKGLADEIRVGKLGDLIAIKRGTGGGKKIMLVAHMDEIGLMVTHVDKRGYARVAPLGGVFPLYSVRARVLFADGRLVKFFAGEQKPFEIKGLPEPLSAPVAVVASLEDDYLYIADAGNGRIVEIAKDGQFKRQFRPSEGDALRDMRNLYLDETTGSFYILTSDNLYKANLPRPESAPAAAQPASPTPRK